MTTLVSVPYNEGVALISDSRATDLRSLQRFHTSKQARVLKSADGLEIHVASAGASIGRQAQVDPLIKLFQKQINKYVIDVHLLDELQFINLFNNIALRCVVKYPREFVDVDSHFIFIIKTKKVVFAMDGGIFGMCRANNLDSQTYEDLNVEGNFIQVGSGGRYLLGAVLLQNNLSPWINKSKQQVIDWFKNYFKYVLTPDIGSSVKPGFNITLVPLKGNTESLLIKN